MADSSLKLKQKLFFTCKYFSATSQVPIIYKLFVDDTKTNDIFEASLQISDTLPDSIQKCSISSILNVYSLKSDVLSSLIPKIYKCEATHIDIIGQILSFQETQLLIGHGNVVDLTLDKGTQILFDNGNPVPFDEILGLTPKVEIIR